MVIRSLDVSGIREATEIAKTSLKEDTNVILELVLDGREDDFIGWEPSKDYMDEMVIRINTKKMRIQSDDVVTTLEGMRKSMENDELVRQHNEERLNAIGIET